MLFENWKIFVVPYMRIVFESLNVKLKPRIKFNILLVVGWVGPYPWY